MDKRTPPPSIDHATSTSLRFSGAMTIPEFCRRYSIGRSLTYQEHKAGRLSFRKVGSRSVILLGEAERWAASLPEAIK